jgi:hypothetical protein
MQSLDRFVYKVEAIIIFYRIFHFMDRGLSVKFCDFLELFMYWKLCGLGAWDVDHNLVSVHHGLAEAMMVWFIRDGCTSNSGGRDDRRGATEEGNDDDGWSSDDMLLQLRRR